MLVCWPRLLWGGRMLTVSDLARHPGRKALHESGRVYVWDDGELYHLAPGPFNDDQTVMLPGDVMWFYRPVPDGQEPVSFMEWIE